jgi:hypothetical protein
LFSSSVVRLFGRLIDGVALYPDKLKASLSGGNKQFREELTPDTKLARIYAFSFEGQFNTLPKPMLFFVHGEGVEAQTDTGLANVSLVTFDSGIMCWKRDKDDFTLRAEIVLGTLDDILIDATLSPTSKYPIISRAGTSQEASWRDGQMIARNRLQ